MSDARRRRGVPDRWLLPPEPAGSQLRARWRELDFERRRALARVGPEELPGRPAHERQLVVGLARRRLATAWRLLAGAPLLGWFVLMTVWGFGRSTYPADERMWLVAGLTLGAAVWVVGAVHTAGRLRRARDILATDGRGSEEAARG